jgi:hypothetical protein
MEEKLIYKAIPKIMGQVGAIGKDRKNTMQGYNFRGIDDAYNALNSVMSEHGVFTVSRFISERTEERASKNGGVLIYRIFHIEYTFFATDGSFVKTETIGEGMDNGDKSSNKAQAVAHKYALLQIFAIPTEEKKDPEHDSPVVAEVMTPLKDNKSAVLNDNGLSLWSNRIQMARTADELAVISGKIQADGTLTPQQLDTLRGIYKAKLEAITEKGVK